MKKLLIIALALAMLLALAGCACEHEWMDADCVTPKTCANCSEIEGAPLGHTWSAATCVDPKVCEDCGATYKTDETDMIAHDFSVFVGSTAGNCSEVGTTTYKCATCEATNVVEGAKGDHIRDVRRENVVNATFLW